MIRIPWYAILLDPWLDVALLAVCVYHWRASRHMWWLIAGYGLLCLAGSPMLEMLSLTGHQLDEPRMAFWQALFMSPIAQVVTWGSVVIGLYLVLSDLSARVSKRDTLNATRHRHKVRHRAQRERRP